MAGESVVPRLTGAPEPRPGVDPAGAPVQNLYLGQGGFYLSPTARSSDDYRIVENDQTAEAATREGDLPLVIPARGLAHSPTPQELDEYLRAQYETPDAPFGDLARQRSGYRGTPPQVWSGIARLGVSAGLFALTHNLWLILITQGAAQALLLRSREASSSP